MSYFNSLKQLWLKIEQKNIVLVNGNVDEIIPTKLEAYASFNTLNEFAENSFIPLIEHLCSIGKNLGFETINYFCANEGIVDYLNKNKTNQQTNNNENCNNSNDDFLSLSNQELNQENKVGLINFIDDITQQINLIYSDLSNVHKKLFIIDCSDILLQANNSDITNTKLAELISCFTNFKSQQIQHFYNNKIKLVLIARNDNVINKLIGSNNVEFCSLTLQKPDKYEREAFFDFYQSKFHSLSEICKQKNSKDYLDLISLTDGMSFRQMFQFAKIDPLLIDDNLSFKNLYKLITFNKSQSEWEKLDFNQLKNIDAILTKRVKGQQQAIDQVKRTLIRSFSGMNGILHSTDDNRKPKGVLFFVGPTGVGKTELAKSISEFIFGDENRIIRFDMSEFNHEHSDQRLIGAPPGYVGYDAGGELTNAIKQQPFCILLFDEIEKAHSKILDKFLQILEDGRLTSSQGETIDFSQTFIIFTSNIGAKEAFKLKDIENREEIKTFFLERVNHHFIEELNRPELLNRIGIKNIVPFVFVNDNEIIKEIINSKLEKLQVNLKQTKNIILNFKNTTKTWICNQVIETYDKSLGGRDLINKLENVLIDSLATFIFNKTLEINKSTNNNELVTISINVNDNKLAFKLDN